jgi:hypothetical protein
VRAKARTGEGEEKEKNKKGGRKRILKKKDFT